MSFDVSRLRRGERMVAVGAIALFVFMFFFKWFGVTVPNLVSAFVRAAGYSTSFNAWHTMADIRWLLLLAVIAGLALVALVGTGRKLELPVSLGTIVAGLGALATVFVFYRVVIDHPGGGDVNVKIGAWLGLIACAILTYGGYLTMQAEGTTLADVREQARASFDNVTTSATTASATAEGGEPDGDQGETPAHSPSV